MARILPDPRKMIEFKEFIAHDVVFASKEYPDDASQCGRYTPEELALPGDPAQQAREGP